MEHIRRSHLEVDQPIDEFVQRKAAEKAILIDEKYAGPNFFRGLIVASAISMLLWTAVYNAFA